MHSPTKESINQVRMGYDNKKKYIVKGKRKIIKDKSYNPSISK